MPLLNNTFALACGIAGAQLARTVSPPEYEFLGSLMAGAAGGMIGDKIGEAISHTQIIHFIEQRLADPIFLKNMMITLSPASIGLLAYIFSENPIAAVLSTCLTLNVVHYFMKPSRPVHFAYLAADNNILAPAQAQPPLTEAVHFNPAPAVA